MYKAFKGISVSLEKKKHRTVLKLVNFHVKVYHSLVKKIYAAI